MAKVHRLYPPELRRHAVEWQDLLSVTQPWRG
jgi:hypothetical protein